MSTTFYPAYVTNRYSRRNPVFEERRAPRGYRVRLEAVAQPPKPSWYRARNPRHQELPMPNKAPQKNDSKKPGKSLKEKRADKKAKKDSKRSGF
jgi:hypothetical protein